VGDKGGRCVGLKTLPPYVSTVMKSGSLHLLVRSGSVQTCNGIAVPSAFFVFYPVMMFRLQYASSLYVICPSVQTTSGVASPDFVSSCEAVEALEMLRNLDVGQLKVERYTEQEGKAARDRCVSKYGVGILLAVCWK